MLLLVEEQRRQSRHGVALGTGGGSAILAPSSVCSCVLVHSNIAESREQADLVKNRFLTFDLLALVEHSC